MHLKRPRRNVSVLANAQKSQIAPLFAARNLFKLEAKKHPSSAWFSTPSFCILSHCCVQWLCVILHKPSNLKVIMHFLLQKPVWPDWSLWTRRPRPLRSQSRRGPDSDAMGERRQRKQSGDWGKVCSGVCCHTKSGHWRLGDTRSKLNAGLLVAFTYHVVFPS